MKLGNGRKTACCFRVSVNLFVVSWRKPRATHGEILAQAVTKVSRRPWRRPRHFRHTKVMGTSTLRGVFSKRPPLLVYCVVIRSV